MILVIKNYFDHVINMFILDDEKFIFKPGLKLEETRQFAYENAKDIIACGFDLDKTFIFLNTDYVGFVSIYFLLILVPFYYLFS